MSGYVLNGPEDETPVDSVDPGAFEDAANLAEIERELEQVFDHEDDDIPDEFYEFLEKSEQYHSGYGDSYLPSGAVPSGKVGKLDPFAAEFWFPGSRECTCCKGYKHGCVCVTGNKFYACQLDGCCEAAHKDMKLDEPLPAHSPKSPANHGAVHASVPSQNGKLSSHAAEFWFPQSRECGCCKGYKHGCDCCTKEGFYACQKEGCCEAADLGKRNTSSPGKSPGGGAGHFSPGKQQNSGNYQNTNSKPFCRFEMSPGGCNMGERCRFQHVYSYASTQQQPQQQYYGGYQQQGYNNNNNNNNQGYYGGNYR